MEYLLYQHIILHAKNSPEKPAIIAPGRTSLSYADFTRQIKYTVATLNALGVRRGDQVALVLPNGPDLASALISVAACTTVVPLDPALSSAECKAILLELDIKALITNTELTASATIAHGLGVSVFYLLPGPKAGQFEFAGEQLSESNYPDYAQIDDLAFILRTSSSTGPAKSVPLTHKLVSARSQQVIQAGELSTADRYLAFMPLSLSHGLSLGINTPFTVGMSVIFMPAFDAETFFYCLKEFHPTYYSSSFTHQQTILKWIKEKPAAITGHTLRFIWSASGPLTQVVQNQLEQLFKVPVVQFAGATEVGTIAGNPLPPKPRKAATIGIPWNNEIAIMDENAKRLPAGETGEVWIRGDSVISAYYNNPEASRAAFVDGWFRTGDLGFFDDDGYLTLCGRIKEIINRGGQKVSCHEVDTALREHPGVVEAFAFPVPHQTLDEEVAAAIVPHKEASLDQSMLTVFLRDRLTAYKIPTRMVFTHDIPKTTNGKVQRGRLAQYFRLGADQAQHFVAPEDDVEKKIADIWTSAMSLENIGRDNTFIALGGNSLLAVQIVSQIKKRFNVDLIPGDLLATTTISALANRITQKAINRSDFNKALVALSSRGTRPPIYFIHGREGTVWDYLKLIQLLDEDQPAYGLQNLNQDRNAILSTTVEDMIAEYVDEIRCHQPEGPYYLCGFSRGGLFAFEAARQLLSQKQKIGLLAIIDTFPPNIEKSTPFATLAFFLLRRIAYHARTASANGKLTDKAFYRERLHALQTHLGLRERMAIDVEDDSASEQEEDPYRIIGDRYVPQPIDAPLTFFLTTAISKVAAWKQLAKKGISIHQLPTTHDGMLKTAYVNQFSILFNKILTNAQKKHSL